MYIPKLDSSCKYYFIGAMIYRWVAPKDMEQDTIFRLKLTTDVPPTTHLSGKFQLSNEDAESLDDQRGGCGTGGDCFLVVGLLVDSTAAT
jgi:hypothetical protein